MALDLSVLEHALNGELVRGKCEQIRQLKSEYFGAPDQTPDVAFVVGAIYDGLEERIRGLRSAVESKRDREAVPT
jgi:hypothetical protein